MSEGRKTQIVLLDDRRLDILIQVCNHGYSFDHNMTLENFSYLHKDNLVIEQFVLGVNPDEHIHYLL